MKKLIWSLVFAAAFTAAPAYAVAINFDSLGANVAVTNQFAAQGVIFSETATFGFTFPGSSSPIALCGAATNSGSANCVTDITLRFVDPLNSSVNATTDFVSILFGDIEIAGNFLRAFDINNVELGTVIVASSPGAQLISFSQAGIHSVILHSASDVAFDDLTFNDVTAVTSGVPEPSSALLILSGLAPFVYRRFRKSA